MQFLKRIGLILTLIITLLGSKAQPSKFIIQLKDKVGSLHSLSNPTTYLAPASIERKSKYMISIDSSDLPISQRYVDSILNAGKVKWINGSKWLNQILIQTTDEEALKKINQFPFVLKTSPIANRPSTTTSPEFKEELTTYQNSNLNQGNLTYGSSFNQIAIHQGEYIHKKGYQGKGIRIAVLDAGFYKYQNLSAFDSVRLKGGIPYTYDFVEMNNSVNEDDAHGMYCLSIMAANIPGLFVGTAPEASYYLFRTEDVNSEFPIEEQNWVVAAEFADSIGMDMISSSLGYSVFDDPSYNYTYSQMNGNSTLVSKGASLAAKKGMIVMNSAGNSGSSSWKYITAPADANPILAVGAINTNKLIAPFSSYGPSSDKRVKPDIVSVGWNTALINSNGGVSLGNGTSFSNPNIAGLIACLWQAFPEFTNYEIMDAIRKSADQYANPDNRKGYGIPNLKTAFEILEKERITRKTKEILKEQRIKLFPNPVVDRLNLAYRSEATDVLAVEIKNMEGKTLIYSYFNVQPDQFYQFTIDQLDRLPSAQYILQYKDVKGTGIIRFIK